MSPFLLTVFEKKQGNVCNLCNVCNVKKTIYFVFGGLEISNKTIVLLEIWWTNFGFSKGLEVL